MEEQLQEELVLVNDAHGLAVPAPRFLGWKAMGRDTPFQSTDCFANPYEHVHEHTQRYIDDWRAPTVRHQLGNVNVGGTIEQGGVSNYWVLYRPHGHIVNGWVRLDDPEELLHDGDSVYDESCDDPTNREHLQVGQIYGPQFNNRPLEELYKMNPHYRAWRKLEEANPPNPPPVMAPEAPEAPRTRPRSPGNERFARQLPLP